MCLTDTHCHLDHPKFHSDQEDVIQRAQACGVSRILVPGTTVASSLSAVKIAEEHSQIFAAVGVHPNDAGTWDTTSIDSLRVMGKNRKVVAIGEIGLDYYWNATSHTLQKQIFQEQLDLASSLNLPVVIHFRESRESMREACADDLLTILDKWVNALRADGKSLDSCVGVLHSFSGSLDTANRAITLRFYIGVTGPVTFVNARKQQEIIESQALENLLIETDSPYLAPHPHRGKRNEPSYVSLVAGKIASLHGVEVEKVMNITTANAANLFKW